MMTMSRRSFCTALVVVPTAAAVGSMIPTLDITTPDTIIRYAAGPAGPVLMNGRYYSSLQAALDRAIEVCFKDIADHGIEPRHYTPTVFKIDILATVRGGEYANHALLNTPHDGIHVFGGDTVILNVGGVQYKVDQDAT